LNPHEASVRAEELYANNLRYLRARGTQQLSKPHSLSPEQLLNFYLFFYERKQTVLTE